MQRRLPARADKFRISLHAGLSAGRKRCSPENDDNRSTYVPETSGRDRGRLGNMSCFNGDVRVVGTIDGHVASPIPAPNLSPTRNEGRTVAERDQPGINAAISLGCDYCATTLRKRVWPNAGSSAHFPKFVLHREPPTFTNFGKSWATHKPIDSSTALSI